MEKLRTTPAADGFHMPGEFEPHAGCIMIWPKRPGSWNYGAKKAREAFAAVARAIAESEPVYMLAEPDVAEDAGKMLGCARAGGGEEESFAACKEALAGCDESDGGESPKIRGTGDCGGIPAACVMGNRSEITEARSLSDRGGNPGCGITVIEMESDDAWARDVGPTFVTDESGRVRGVDWEFNAWGGQVDGLYAHWEKDDLVASRFCEALGYDSYEARPFVLEGGSIHSDGEGTVLVTAACLLSAGRNPGLSKEEIEEKLKAYLGAKKVIWLERGIYNDETNEHVDNICAFARPGEVVLAWTDDESDPQYAMSKSCLDVLERERDAKGRKLLVHKLPIPKKPVCVAEEDLLGYEFEEGEDVREAGERLAASYVNFYISNGAVVLPQFGDENDKRAVEILGQVFPERKIIPIAARDILLGGGNIHCITQQIPAGRKTEQGRNKSRV